MLNPFLALLIAGSVHGAADDAFCPADLTAIVIELTETVGLAPQEGASAPAAPSVCDVRTYYDDFSPYALPETPLIVSYDWRSPIIFDRP